MIFFAEKKPSGLPLVRSIVAVQIDPLAIEPRRVADLLAQVSARRETLADKGQALARDYVRVTNVFAWREPPVHSFVRVVAERSQRAPELASGISLVLANVKVLAKVNRLFFFFLSRKCLVNGPTRITFPPQQECTEMLRSIA